MKPRKPVRYRPKPTTQPPEYREPDTESRMLCRNEFLAGEAVWRRKDGIWACVGADQCLRWMLHMDPATAKFNLAQRGFEWEWKRPAALKFPH